MSAKITSQIPDQNFELIRDRIGLILGEELRNQYLLNPNYPKVHKVWVERCLPFDSETEIPTVNVNIAKTVYDQKTSRHMAGETTFNIDVYTAADTQGGNAGDQLAMLLMNKIIGMIRVILSSPVNLTLQFAPGIIAGTMVEGFFIGDKSVVKDALSNVIGRIQFTVRAVEQIVYTDIPVPITNVTSTLLLGESEMGMVYTWSVQTKVIVGGGKTFKLPFQYAHLEVALIFDGNQAYNSSAFTLSDGVYTMTNGASYPPGTELDIRLKLGDFTDDITLQTAGNSFTLPTAYTNKVIGVVFDGTQAYLMDDGFTRTGNVISFTNGNTYAAGTVFTILYGSTAVPLIATAGNSFRLPDQYTGMEVSALCDGTQAYNSTQFLQQDLTGTITNGVTFNDQQKILAILR